MVLPHVSTFVACSTTERNVKPQHEMDDRRLIELPNELPNLYTGIDRQCVYDPLHEKEDLERQKLNKKTKIHFYINNSKS